MVSEVTCPSARKHRYPPGAQAWVIGGVRGNKIRLWVYVDERWKGTVAAKMYNGPVRKVLQKHRPQKKVWKIVEDNDPSG